MLAYIQVTQENSWQLYDNTINIVPIIIIIINGIIIIVNKGTGSQ